MQISDTRLHRICSIFFQIILLEQQLNIQGDREFQALSKHIITFIKIFFYHQTIFNKSIKTGFFRVHIMLYRGKIKTRITFEGSDMHSNPFRVFTRALCSIYRQQIIEIRDGHLGRFPRQ